MPLRGNVTTRLQNQNFDGMILAEAGLIRLKTPFNYRSIITKSHVKRSRAGGNLHSMPKE